MRRPGRTAVTLCLSLLLVVACFPLNSVVADVVLGLDFATDGSYNVRGWMTFTTDGLVNALLR